MIYAHHNFKENINSIINTKDMKITREMIVSEVAKVIAGKSFEVIKLLNSCKIAVSPEATIRELIVVVNMSMAKSKCLQSGMVRLISGNQGFSLKDDFKMDTDDEFANFIWGGKSDGGVTETATGSKSSGNLVNSLGQLLQVGYGVWNTGQSRKDSASQREHEMQLARMNIDLMNKQMDFQNRTPDVTQAGVGGGGSSTLIYILLGVGVLAAIGFAVWSSKQDK